MTSISCWNDLKPFGFDPLTGEACGLSYRILFDITARGQAIIEKCLGCRITPAEPWNRGHDKPHVGSVMLSQELLIPLGIFALLESGHKTVWLLSDQSLVGFEADEEPDTIWLGQRSIARTLGYRGTAGDRNVHMMSGRTE